MNTDHLLIFGLGYAATAIAAQTRSNFNGITATNRTLVKDTNDDYRHLMFDGNEISNDLADVIAKASHILISIGPDEMGDPVLNCARQLIAENYKVKWIGYLSTVGVYGNHDGAWVDEETLCRPVSKRSIERLDAENKWQKLAAEMGVGLTIFRLSGIYGPGRNALVNVEKGRSRRLIKKGQVFNRIHRDDIAIAVDKAILLNAAGIFNITDDEPAPPQDVVTYVHKLRGSEPPAEIDFESADITPMARSFYGENKRVSNTKSKQILAMDYQWPNYRMAFDAMWNRGNWR